MTEEVAMDNWVEITADKIKVGDRLRVYERYRDVTVTYEGEARKITADLVHFGDYGPQAYIENQSLIEVQIFVARPPLPTAVGSVIKIGRDAAVLTRDDSAPEDVLRWTYAATHRVRVPNSNLADAEVLFDAGA